MNNLDLDIKNSILTIRKLKKLVLSDKNFFINKDFQETAIILTPLSSQIYGPRIEEKLSEVLNLKKSNDKNRGDKINSSGRYIEIKGSFNSTKLNIVQIRPWQDISEYIIYLWNVDNNFILRHSYFHLSKKEMNNELKLLNAGYAHGTMGSNLNNKNKEYALHIDLTSNHFNRWLKTYYADIDTLKYLINC